MDVQKRFLTYRMYPKYLAAPQFAAAIWMKVSLILQKEEDVQEILLVDW